MRAFIKFNKGILRMPMGVQLWLLVLMIANMVVPLFFFGRLEARVVLLTFLANFLLMVILTALAGFTRLLGAGHVLWIPLLVFLLTRTDQFDVHSPFGIWLVVLMVVNSISLILDAIDVYRYVSGEREEVVQGL